MLVKLSESNEKIIEELEIAINNLNEYYLKAKELEKILQFKDAAQKKYKFITGGLGKFSFYFLTIFLLGFIIDFIPMYLGKFYFVIVGVIALVLGHYDPIYKKLLNYYSKNIERLNEKIKKADLKIKRTNEELILIKENATYIYTLLPERYANTYAAKKLIEYIRTFRADNLKEAIKLYENEEAEKNKEALREQRRKEENARKAVAGIVVFSLFTFLTCFMLTTFAMDD